MADKANIYFEEHNNSNEVGRQALRGGAAAVVSRMINAVIQVTSAILLARLLGPEDFGLVAMVAVLSSFAPLLIDFGLGDATIQKASITRGQVSCLFWISSGIGLMLTVLMAACSPLIAWMYRDHRLEPIALVSSVAFVLLGMSGQHMALLRRKLEFVKIAKIEILSNLIAVVVAIALAALGFGYWGLVFRPVVYAGCIVTGAWLVCRWKPGMPAFDGEVRKMLRFGMHVVGFTLTYMSGKSADRFALGLFYAPQVVGFYQNALNLYESSVLAFISPMHGVGTAALSKLQSVPDLLKKKYFAALSALAFYIMPAAAILSVLSQDIVVILLGQKWRVAGSLLGVLALRGMVQVIDGSQGWLHLSTGRPDRWMKWGIITSVMQVLGIAAGLSFGARGVAIGYVISGCIIAFPAIIYAGRPVSIGMRDILAAVGRQLLAAVTIAGAGWWLRTNVLAQISIYYRVALLSLCCISLYLFIVVVLFRVVDPIRLGIRLVREHLPADLALKLRFLCGWRASLTNRGPGTQV